MLAKLYFDYYYLLLYLRELNCANQLPLTPIKTIVNPHALFQVLSFFPRQSQLRERHLLTRKISHTQSPVGLYWVKKNKWLNSLHYNPCIESTSTIRHTEYTSICERNILTER